MRPENTEDLAVGGELEILDGIGLKGSDLAAAGAIERLEPEVVHTVLENGIYDCASIGCEPWIPRDPPIGVEQPHRWTRPRIERNQRNFLVGDVCFNPVDKNSQVLAVGGNAEAGLGENGVGNHRSRHNLRRSTIYGHAHNATAAGPIFVVTPLSVRYAFRTNICRAVSKLFEVRAVGRHAPEVGFTPGVAVPFK